MKTLLHVCCANCAIYPVKILREQGQAVTGYFFNPNIHPFLEFKRRLDTVKDYAERTSLAMIYREEYLLENFLSQVAAKPAGRCDYCYQSRLEATARYASENGFSAFTSSLLYSRFQNHSAIREQGEALGRRFGIRFVYEDFRKGWNEGINISKSMGLYRQQYCGCIYSEQDRYAPRAVK
ncbi:epoxyqueuosine reductase QueH [Trichloromonas sp.]|uniref:epoxyqueuosine reductase QueH n=1 Tax=Trichloromonas sp. TaxID=3069249 RepID=UPI003D819E4F